MVCGAACVPRAHMSADSGERGALVVGVRGELFLLLPLLLPLLGGVRTGAAGSPAAGPAGALPPTPAAWRAGGLLLGFSPLWPAPDKQRPPTCNHHLAPGLSQVR